MSQINVLIDTDAGTDDALALMMAFAAHKRPDIQFNIVGIVCVNGNTKVDNVIQNVARTMLTSNINFPLYAGCGHPIVYNFEPKGPPYHGEDGFGDANLPPVTAFIESKHGVTAIVDLAHKYKDNGKLTILAFGPMSNLALAIRMDPSIKDCIKEIYAMGGNMEGVGNITVSAEFNFAVDPESAYITLSSYTCPIYIVPWETCKKLATTTEWRRNVLGAVNSNEARLLNQIEANILAGSGLWYPADQLIAAALIEPAVARNFVGESSKKSKKKQGKASVRKYCTVELNGKYTRGMMVVDHDGHLEKPENVTLLTEFDTQLFRRMLIWAVGGPYYKLVI